MIRANFDYEKELFWQKSEVKSISEFEYLYWITEDSLCPLFVHGTYSEEYLDYLRSIIDQEPKMSKNYTSNWWGDLKDLELERTLNSKLTSTQFAIENNFAHKTTRILKDSSQIQLAAEKKYVLKDPTSMSGRDFIFIDENNFSAKKKNIEELITKTPVIFERWLEKELDFGSYYFYQTKNFESYLNLSNKQGNYKGTYVFANPLASLDFLNDHGIQLDSHLKNVEIIIEHYLSLGAQNGFSIDAFKHAEGIYTLSEINYRKTMGHVALKMKKFLSQSGEGLFVIHKPINKYKTFSDIKFKIGDDRYSFLKKEGILLLSDEKKMFLTFFIAAKNQSQLNSYYELITKL